MYKIRFPTAHPVFFAHSVSDLWSEQSPMSLAFILIFLVVLVTIILTWFFFGFVFKFGGFFWGGFMFVYFGFGPHVKFWFRHPGTSQAPGWHQEGTSLMPAWRQYWPKLAPCLFLARHRRDLMEAGKKRVGNILKIFRFGSNSDSN